MDNFLEKSANPIILFVVVPCVALLLLYFVIRMAVGFALRDHQKWIEKTRAQMDTGRPASAPYPPITPRPQDRL